MRLVTRDASEEFRPVMWRTLLRHKPLGIERVWRSLVAGPLADVGARSPLGLLLESWIEERCGGVTRDAL
jgi:hypothetical protein